MAKTIAILLIVVGCVVVLAIVRESIIDDIKDFFNLQKDNENGQQ